MRVPCLHFWIKHWLSKAKVLISLFDQLSFSHKTKQTFSRAPIFSSLPCKLLSICRRSFETCLLTVWLELFRSWPLVGCTGGNPAEPVKRFDVDSSLSVCVLLLLVTETDDKGVPASLLMSLVNMQMQAEKNVSKFFKKQRLIIGAD